MNGTRISLPKPQGHHCFACGTVNPFGLKLDFYASDDSVCADVVLDEYRVGWEGIAHGGIISTLLDEIMSWSIIYCKRVFFVTRKMEVRYLKPVPVQTPLTVRGRLGKELEPPKIEARAELLNQKGQLLARSTGEFVELGPDKLPMIPKNLRWEMESLFELFGEAR
jgi:acyl-coenzyme A thioesterase PaaI-like protein